MAQEPLLTLPLADRPTADRPAAGTGAARRTGGSRGAVAPMTWRLDDRTRQVGRRGVAQAREALRNARRQLPDAA